MKRYTLLLFFITGLPFFSWAQPASGKQKVPYKIPSVLKPALEGITAQTILKHVQVLSSDEFEGRAPGTHGDTLTVDYLTGQFKKTGLLPGNPDGSYEQQVPMIGSTLQKVSLSVTANGKTIPLRFPDDYIAGSSRHTPEISVTGSDLVFAGYGIVAPQYGWDDYKDIDVKGKAVIVLDHEPVVKAANDPGKKDTSFFKGDIQTYYAQRWYKTAVAAKKGAAVLFVIHDPQTAFAPFKVYQNSALLERIDLHSPGSQEPVLMADGHLTLEAFTRLCNEWNKDATQLQQMAMRKDFVPVNLGGSIHLNIQNRVRTLTSRNVVAKLEGSDKKLKDEYVIYSAHWDHLGKDTSLRGDQIYNGAADNASGVAAILTIAKAFAALKTKPKRSLLFIATTAEEEGLIGSKYYASHPLYPLTHTLANINIDGISLWGRTKDVWNAGAGLTTIDEVLKQTAQAQNREYKVYTDVKGFFFKSDQVEFAAVGIPSVFPSAGSHIVGKPQDYGEKKEEEYFKNDYHRVSDEVKPDWDLSGAAEDAQWLFLTGYQIVQSKQYPQWKEGAEFKALREAMMKTAGHK